jgi:hypothetical protein
MSIDLYYLHRREIITVKQKSNLSRLPSIDPPSPSPPSNCVHPAFVGRAITHSPGREGDGGAIFWKTKEMKLPSYINNLSTIFMF